MNDKTTKELTDMYEEAIAEWDKSGSVFSLTDFEEVVIEIERRRILKANEGCMYDHDHTLGECIA